MQLGRNSHSEVMKAKRMHLCMVSSNTAERQQKVQAKHRKSLVFQKELLFLAKYYICSDSNTSLKSYENIGTKIMEAAIV